MRIITTTLLVSLALLSSCKTAEEAVGADTPLPAWASSQPLESQYYVGIGMAPKAIGPACVDEARKKALQSLSEEIRVNISANSILFSFEDNQGFRDEYKQFIQVKAADDLQGYELVDSFENEREYWVYYRLSKAKYHEQRKARMKSSAEASKTIMLQGDEARQAGDLAQSLRYYGQAIIAIEEFLGEAIVVEMDGEEAYLGSELAVRMGHLASTFHLNGSSDRLRVVLGKQVGDEALRFTLTGENDVPVAGMPIAFEYSLGIIYPRNAVTDEHGQVGCRLDKVRSQSTNQTVLARVDFQKWGQSLGFSDEVLLKVVRGLLTTEESIVLDVVPPKFGLSQNIKAIDGGELLADKASSIRSAATQKGFVYVNSGRLPDLFFTLQGEFRVVPTSNQLSQVSFSGRFVVRDEMTNTVIFTDEIRPINGVQSTQEQAVLRCEEKLDEYLENIAFQRFYRFYLK